MGNLELELQVIRNGKPRTRVVVVSVPTGVNVPVPVRLPAGADGESSDRIVVLLEGMTWIYDGTWYCGRASISVNGMGLSAPRPFMVTTFATEVPSCVVHFPLVALSENKVFGGIHSLVMRTHG